MQSLGSLFVFVGLLLLCLMPPLGLLLIVVGLLMSILGAVSANAPKPHTGNNCPSCNGPIDGEPAACRHCTRQIYWFEGKPCRSQEELGAWQEWRVQQDRERESKHWDTVRRNRAQIETVRRFSRASLSASKTAVTLVVATVISVAVAFDTLIRKAAGEGNDIIYRFFQAMFYLGIPAVVVALKFMR